MQWYPNQQVVLVFKYDCAIEISMCVCSIKWWLDGDKREKILFRTDFWFLYLATTSYKLFFPSVAYIYKKSNHYTICRIERTWDKNQAKRSGEGVTCVHNKFNLSSHHPLYRLIVWRYLRINIFWISWFSGVTCLLGDQIDTSWVVLGNINVLAWY